MFAMPHRRTIAVFSLVLAVCLCSGATAFAQDCPTGNLLAGKKPIQWQDVKGTIAAVTDGNVAKEGAVWDAHKLTAILDTAAATMTWDLGSMVPIKDLWVQGDANDVLTVWGAGDEKQFKVIGRVEPAEGVHGLRSRAVDLARVVVRYLRIGEGVGDDFYSLSEVQVFCQRPAVFPPKLKVVDAPKQLASTGFGDFWNDESSRIWETIWALLVFALVGWGAWLNMKGRDSHKKKLRDRLMMAVLVISAVTYVNFFSFHFGNFIHSWDTFHYYAGSKYFKELGFERLYECIAIADSEEPGLRRRVELRKITNLRTNALETTEDILAHPERCKSHFTDARWAAFTHDIRYFRTQEGPKRWDDTSTDHGYNATPVWNIAGQYLSNLAPASDTQILWLNLIDPVYYVAMIGVIWWAFGWRTLAVALAVFATNFPNRFYWTGGAYLRWDWLFFLVACICCLRKDKPFLAGMAIGYAGLLRVFPGFVVIGPLIGLIVTAARQRRIWPEGQMGKSYLRFFAGIALSFAILIPISLKTTEGIDTYKAFIKNSMKHKETPLTNYMGLRTVVAFRFDETGEKMRDNSKTDPWAGWKQARIDGYNNAKPLYIAVVLAFLVLIGFAVPRVEIWMLAAFGAAFIPMAVELTCYYYAFIIGVAVLHEKKKEVGLLLLALCAAGEFISLSPLRGMPGWLDVQYTLISFLTVVCFFMVVYWFGLFPYLEERAEAKARATKAAGAEEPNGERAGSGDASAIEGAKGDIQPDRAIAKGKKPRQSRKTKKR